MVVEMDGKAASEARGDRIPLSAGMLLVTLGVVYGDIGTSPMYVMKAIVSGNGGLSTVTEELVLGALSLVIWTITLVTTVKYVVIAMKADNHGEGGIFALYSLVRRSSRWLILPAMVGGAALLADGILTPAVTVTTAIEGLRTVDFGYAIIGDSQAKVVGITIVIICALYFVQKAGTSSIGKLFGPIMTLWFLFLGGAGLVHFVGNPAVLKAFNPLRGLMFLMSPNNHAGLRILGFVFLCTTGAEALYSDMGHVGKANVYASWPAVKACLIMNYLGQGAWLLQNAHNPALADATMLNPFYQMLPEGLRPFSIILSTVAAIIASQALITGSFTLVSEATRLNLMPHLKITYPSETKGQLYIPLVNNIMWAGTVFIVLLFQNSGRMESAYGLAITVTMLMTSTLLVSYLASIRHKPLLAVLFAIVFGAIELSFFVSCCTMFFNGGYVMIILSALLFWVMFVWRRGTAIERMQTVFLPVREYKAQLAELRSDTEEPLLADNLVFLTNDSSIDKLDRDILYSILNKRPKRAKAYWFLNVQVTDEPHTLAYRVNNFGTNYLFKVQIRLGFKVNQRVNAFLRQIVGDMVAQGLLPPQQHKYSIYRDSGAVGDFRFCMIRKLLGTDTHLSGMDEAVMHAKYSIRGFCGDAARWYGLENSNVILEYVPLFTKQREVPHLTQEAILSRDGGPRRAKRKPVEVQDEEDIISGDLQSGMGDTTNRTAELIGGETASFRPLQMEDDQEDEQES